MTLMYRKVILEKFDDHHILDLMLLCELLPNIDKSTIYRNLKRLTETGVLKELRIKEGVTSYELSSHDHPHLLCPSCNKIEELNISTEDIKKHLPKDLQIESLELNVSGLCASCRKDN